ncbi:MAG TPA: cytochrome b N-terminal domain-containing protein [Azospirillaceae bacterium]|nr:cytochrome b N-terminal domain-containing protein [Azospirillaceae bacterium]
MAAMQWKNPVVRWVDSRLPIFTWMHHEYNEYPMPKNCNYLWSFGAISMVMLVTMILTGLFLAMSYTPHTAHAFQSVERIMRDVNSGWLLRYIHMNGASFFFIAVYIHIFRGLHYGSYKQPRELLWMIGVVILLLMMATAFMGYVLPWGQMSFWGATVITNLFSALPLVGEAVVTWLWGGFSVDNPTLNRFFALHFLMPFVILGVVLLHVAALHAPGVGSGNPKGIDMKGPQDAVPFNPYMTVKDTFALTVFLLIFAGFIFFAPNYLGHPDNYIPANPLVTPPHIVPEWYFLPFYAILRAINFNIWFIDSKLGGVLAMFSAIAVLFVLPWLDTSPVRSMKYRPLGRIFFWLLVLDTLILGWVGAKPAEQPYVLYGQLATLYYFAYFLVILPLLGKLERPRPLPTSIAEPVLKGGGRLAGSAAATKPMEKA